MILHAKYNFKKLKTSQFNFVLFIDFLEDYEEKFLK